MHSSKVLDRGGVVANGADLAGARGPQPALLALQVPAGHVQHGPHHPAPARPALHARPLCKLVVHGPGGGVLTVERSKDVGLGVLSRVNGVLVGLRVGNASGIAEAVPNINVLVIVTTGCGKLVVVAQRGDHPTLALHANALPPLGADTLESLPSVLEVAGAGRGQAGGLVGGRGGVGPGDRGQGPYVVQTLELCLKVLEIFSQR